MTTTTMAGFPPPFVSPVVQRRKWIADKGRDCIAQKHIQTGQLLISEQPYTVHYHFSADTTTASCYACLWLATLLREREPNQLELLMYDQQTVADELELAYPSMNCQCPNCSTSSNQGQQQQRQQERYGYIHPPAVWTVTDDMVTLLPPIQLPDDASSLEQLARDCARVQLNC